MESENPRPRSRGKLSARRPAGMSTADTYARVRIDADTKERAADALEAMGLSISDAIRLLIIETTT